MEGSKKLTIELKLKDLLFKVKTNSYYIGEARKDIQGMDLLGARIQSSDDDDDILVDFLKSSFSKIGNILTKLIGESSFVAVYTQTDTAKVTFTINTAANFMESQLPVVKSISEDYAVDYVLMEWFSSNKPDESKLFADKIGLLESDIRAIAVHRKKPVRTTETI